MEDSKNGQPQKDRPDDGRPIAEGVVSRHPNAPSQQKQPGDGFQKAKQIAWRFIGRPVKYLADRLTPYNGLLTALATIALAVLTYFLAVYANELGHISERQLVDNEATQRAFVTQSGFSGPDTFNFGDSKTMTRYNFGWTNSGTTAAFHLRVNTQCGYRTTEMTDGRQTPFWNIPDGGEPTYLAPKETATIGNCSIRNDLMADLVARKRFFYLMGRADYIDAFGRPHIVKDCTELVFQPNGTTDYVTCPHFTCTDNDCQ